MKITIILNKKELRHFKDCSDYLDTCEIYRKILLKIKKNIDISINNMKGGEN
jgi:hypothetical protein